MLLFAPFLALNWVLIIYVAAAIIPAIFLMRYIYSKDEVEKEPPYLLWSLIVGGVLAGLVAIALETLGTFILDRSISSDDPRYVIVLAFLVVAAAEEGAKLFFLKRRSWNDPNFNYMYDAVVYSAFVSLGFAAFENIEYVFGYGLSVFFARALFAIPGHLGFSVFMGVFYGRAKLCERYGNSAGKTMNLILAFVSAVALHGFYDACAMMNTTESSIAFYVFVAVMYVVVYRMIRNQSLNDRPL